MRNSIIKVMPSSEQSSTTNQLTLRKVPNCDRNKQLAHLMDLKPSQKERLTFALNPRYQFFSYEDGLRVLRWTSLEQIKKMRCARSFCAIGQGSWIRRHCGEIVQRLRTCSSSWRIESQWEKNDRQQVSISTWRTRWRGPPYASYKVRGTEVLRVSTGTTSCV